MSVPYLDVDEVECINRALKHYRSQIRDNTTKMNVEKLIKMFPVGKQIFFEKKYFDTFAPKYKKLLKEALHAYQPQAQSDLPNALRILKYLT